MSKKPTSKEDVVNLFIPQKSTRDSLLATTAGGMIIGNIALIGLAPSLSQAVRLLLATSVGSSTVSLLLLLWFNPRLERRSQIMKRMVEKRVEKVKEDIQKFTSFFYTPLFKANLINNLTEIKTMKFNSKKEFRQAIKKAANEAMKESEPTAESQDFTIKMFYKDFIKDMFYMDEKIFHSPLDEDNRRMKHFLDIFSFRFRYHFFVVGILSLAFSIILHLLIN